MTEADFTFATNEEVGMWIEDPPTSGFSAVHSGLGTRQHDKPYPLPLSVQHETVKTREVAPSLAVFSLNVEKELRQMIKLVGETYGDDLHMMSPFDSPTYVPIYSVIEGAFQRACSSSLIPKAPMGSVDTTTKALNVSAVAAFRVWKVHQATEKFTCILDVGGQFGQNAYRIAAAAPGSTLKGQYVLVDPALSSQKHLNRFAALPGLYPQMTFEAQPVKLSKYVKSQLEFPPLGPPTCTICCEMNRKWSLRCKHCAVNAMRYYKGPKFDFLLATHSAHYILANYTESNALHLLLKVTKAQLVGTFFDPMVLDEGYDVHTGIEVLGSGYNAEDDVSYRCVSILGKKTFNDPIVDYSRLTKLSVFWGNKISITSSRFFTMTVAKPYLSHELQMRCAHRANTLMKVVHGITIPEAEINPYVVHSHNVGLKTPSEWHDGMQKAVLRQSASVDPFSGKMIYKQGTEYVELQGVNWEPDELREHRRVYSLLDKLPWNKGLPLSNSNFIYDNPTRIWYGAKYDGIRCKYMFSSYGAYVFFDMPSPNNVEFRRVYYTPYEYVPMRKLEDCVFQAEFIPDCTDGEALADFEIVLKGYFVLNDVLHLPAVNDGISNFSIRWSYGLDHLYAHYECRSISGVLVTKWMNIDQAIHAKIFGEFKNDGEYAATLKHFFGPFPTDGIVLQKLDAPLFVPGVPGTAIYVKHEYTVDVKYGGKVYELRSGDNIVDTYGKIRVDKTYGNSAAEVDEIASAISVAEYGQLMSIRYGKEPPFGMGFYHDVAAAILSYTSGPNAEIDYTRMKDIIKHFVNSCDTAPYELSKVRCMGSAVWHYFNNEYPNDMGLPHFNRDLYSLIRIRTAAGEQFVTTGIRDSGRFKVTHIGGFGGANVVLIHAITAVLMNMIREVIQHPSMLGYVKGSVSSIIRHYEFYQGADVEMPLHDILDMPSYDVLDGIEGAEDEYTLEGAFVGMTV